MLCVFSLACFSRQNDPATCDIRLVFERIIRVGGYVSGKTSAQRYASKSMNRKSLIATINSQGGEFLIKGTLPNGSSSKYLPIFTRKEKESDVGI
jgi:hypothetical protein